MGFFDFLLDMAEGALIGVGVAAAAMLVVGVAVKITCDVIKRKTKEKYAEAKKVFVKRLKNAKTVDIDVFGTSNNKLGEMSIESDEGIGSDVRVGQTIYLYN